ncbi:MAG: protein kinase [Elusimicrobia bacterium]|nr:protein kinase [Elusimicrobiota bacterium]
MSAFAVGLLAAWLGASPAGAEREDKSGSRPSAAGEGGPRSVPAAPSEPEKKASDEYLGGLPEPGARERFQAELSGLPPEQRRGRLRALAAFAREGEAGLERLALESGLDPAQLVALLGAMRPYLYEGSGPSRRRLKGLGSRVWRRLAERYPDRPEAFSGAGRDYLERGDPASAAGAFDRAIALGARSPQDYLGRGLAAERLGDFEQANADAAAALSSEPANANAKALYLLTLGRVSRVKLELHGGAWETPSDAALPEPVAPERSRPGPAPAQAPPPGAQRWTREASRALELGDPAAATLAADRALAEDASSPQAYHLRAIARERSGDRLGAVQDASTALRLAPDSVPALTARSWAYSGLRRFSLAVEDAGRAVGLAPRDAYGRFALARAEGGLGRRESMLESLRQAAALNERFAPTLARALQLPASADTELLFDGALAGAAGPPAPRSGARRFLVLLAFTLAGGVLVALGLLHVCSPAWRERVTATLRRAGHRARPSPDPAGAPAGKFWERYAFNRVVASGGMGIVYEAVDRGLERRVAVKKMRGEIRDDPGDRGRFLKEARLVAALRHPGIVEIFSIVEDGADIYLVFEFVEGRTLQAALAERGRLSLAEAAAVLKDVCAALEHAQSQGVVHRDLKPSNIMVTPAGRARVMDCGSARRTRDARWLALTAVSGTPPYMAPEAEEGLVCPESDVFSLGVCLYELVTGRVPFSGSAGAMSAHKQAARYQPATERSPGLPSALDRIIAKALSPDPRARYPGPAPFYSELASLL